MNTLDQLLKALNTFINNFKVRQNTPDSKKQEAVSTHKTPVEPSLVTEEVVHEEHKNLVDHQSKTVVTPPPVILGPQLVVRQPYPATHPDTLAIRQIIKDQFTGGKNSYDLQCVEYVHYKVKEKTGVEIQWPSDRPRHGGLWASIFQRNNLYKVMDEPTVHCAMSFTKPDFNAPYGHVAFVEEVLADGSVRISEANWPNKGIYNERVVKKDDLETKYQARFIDFK